MNTRDVARESDNITMKLLVFLEERFLLKYGLKFKLSFVFRENVEQCNAI